MLQISGSQHQPQLRNVPDYIVPQSLKKMSLPTSSSNTGWKESIGHGSKLKGFLAHIYADLTDLT